MSLLADGLKFFQGLDAAGFGLFGLIITMVIIIASSAFKIANFIDYFKTRKIRLLDNTVDINKLSFEMVETQKDIISSDLFRLATGIRANKYLRLAILNLFHYSCGEISYEDIRKSKQYIKFEKNNLSVELPKFSKFIKWTGDVFYWIFILIGIAYLILLLIANPLESSNISDLNSWFKFISVVILCIAFITTAFLALGFSSEIRAAEKIKKFYELNKLKITSDGVFSEEEKLLFQIESSKNATKIEKK